MGCPHCGSADVVHDTRDVPYTYKGRSTVIPQVVGDYCNACGEATSDLAEARRVSALMLEFNKMVNGSAVDPSYIAGVRKKLNLDQRQAAEIFGGGANAFSRYETGRSQPPVSLVKLFKVLDRHPDLLPEVLAD